MSAAEPLVVRPVFKARWPDRVRLPLDFAPGPLAAELAVAAADWTRHFVRQNYEGEWTVAPLRCGASASHPIHKIGSDPSETEWVDTPLLAAMPAFRAVLAAFRCPLKVVRLMRLGPGSTIKPHGDHDLAAENGVARLHVPILTNDRVDFRLNGERVDMAPGSTWYLRLADTHSVVNGGDSDRVHLVIDVVVDAWLRGLLDAASGPAQAVR